MSLQTKIDDLLAKWETLRRRGENTSVEEICRDNPELLESLRRKVRALEAMDPVLRSDPVSQIPIRSENGSGKAWENSDGLRPGSEPLEGYILETVLGRGGFGEVWKARGPGGFHVALKFVSLAGQLAKAELRALNTIKGLHHSHLLPIFGAWQKKNTLIIAMELAEQSLHDRLCKATSQNLPGIPKDELFRYMGQAAEALDFLNTSHHHIGNKEQVAIQHRDVKPQNFLLVGGAVKLGDFGLVRILETSATAHTGSLTLSYAPPEFFRGKTTQHSDQYSLAITYCHLRGGRLPFTGNAGQILEGHLRRNPDLSMLPAEERPVVAKALAKGHEFRWPSCKNFVENLSLARKTFTRTTLKAAIAGKLADSPMPSPGMHTISKSKQNPWAFGDSNNCQPNIAGSSRWFRLISFICLLLFVGIGATAFFYSSKGFDVPIANESGIDGAAVASLDSVNISPAGSEKQQVQRPKPFGNVLEDKDQQTHTTEPMSPPATGKGDIQKPAENMDPKTSDNEKPLLVPQETQPVRIPDNTKPAENSNPSKKGIEVGTLKPQMPLPDAKTETKVGPVTAASLLERARTLQSQGQAKQAHEAFSDAIRLDPTNASAFLDRAANHHRLNHWSAEIADCNEALRLAKQNDRTFLAMCYYQRGNAYRRKGSPSNAVRDLTKAIEYKPDFAGAYWMRAIAEKDRGNLERSNLDREMARKLGHP